MITFAPGRICLFGEHQDYLKLPVIAAAIDLGVYVTLKRYRNDNKIIINLPDVGGKKQIWLDYPIKYKSKRDYLRSSLNVLQRAGTELEKGFECEIHGTLPIAAGASSSSALVVSWIYFLLTIAGEKDSFSKVDVARFANQAEVVEFGEAGGFMDHVTSAVGSIVFINHDYSIDRLQAPSNFFMVLGNSLEKKETVNHIKALKENIFSNLKNYQKENPDFSLNSRCESLLNFMQDDRHHREKLKHEYPYLYASIQDY
ncbi:MAG: GHMP family kinase ATP-binding protein, partial [Promethearchaeota archaeon]